MSTIYVITGPMFSNKTTTLFNYIDYFKHIGKKKIYFIKPEIDTLHLDSIESRNRKPIFANSFPTNCLDYEDYIEAFELYRMDLVVIDEAQFFGEWIVDFCSKCREKNISVIVAGLDMDAFQKPFSYMGELLAIADKVEKKKAKCSICRDDASFTIKKNDNPDQISIGSDDKYEPRCGKHLNTSVPII